MNKMGPSSIVSIPKYQQTSNKVFHGVQALKAVSRFRTKKHNEVYNPLESLDADEVELLVENDYQPAKSSFSVS